MPTQLAHKNLAAPVLDWFDASGRDLPWRAPPGHALPLADPDWPYRVWLSEVMLQQTVVATVKPYFEAFVARWPRVADLAAADDGDVMAAWAGLGYYARARNLLACARAVVRDHHGRFPADEASLRSLPGIGDYTAAAIAAFAFGAHAVVVDGNIERVMARVFAIETPMPAAKPALRAAMATVTPPARAGDFAQALMDLASTLCRPRAPQCLLCPIASLCDGRAKAERYPRKAAKPPKPKRHGTAFWIDARDRVLLVRRPARGLLGGMLALPSCEWRGQGADPPVAADWQLAGQVHHVFTHFELTLTIMRGSVKEACEVMPGGEWWPRAEIDQAGLPSLFAKAARLVLHG